jgi:hypothetical protein
VLDGRIGFTLDAETFSGEITSAWPLALESRGEGEGRREQPKSLRGRYGDASAQFDVSTFSGDVAVVKHPQ